MKKGQNRVWLDLSSASCRARTYDPLIKSLRGYFVTGDSVISCDDFLSNNSSRRSSKIEDADLERILDAWPTLPASLRAGILAMIDVEREQRP